MRQKFQLVFKKVFSDPLYVVAASSLAVNLLLIYYFILLQSTTLAVFLQSNNAFYNWTSAITTLIISILFGMAAGLSLYQFRQAKSLAGFERSILGGVSGAISSGCPVCGAWLISVLGIGGGLAAFPFQGLELKGLALAFLGWSVFASTNSIYNREKGICEPAKNAWQKYFPYAAGIVALVLVFTLPVLATKYNFRISFQPDKTATVASSNIQTNSIDKSAILEKVLPEEGFTINASYGDIGPKMLEAGVIDLEKFKSLYERAGRPLAQKQLNILTQGSDEKITINRENAYFLLNFLWAFGLVNQNQILEKGPLIKYGGLSGVGGFASTGGWTLGKSKGADYYSKRPILALTPRQQKELENFAYNSYRPCCNNSTAFADCNHGMAALGLGEIMASAGASAEEMFEAQKYFNAFWFPQQYLDLALYFKARENKDWQEVDARLVMGKNYSTASGWSRARNWLSSNNLLEKAPSGPGGC